MSPLQEIWLNSGEKWANYIFEDWLNHEEGFKRFLIENEVFGKLSFSSYFSMVTLSKCTEIESLPLEEKRDLWEVAKIWCPGCDTRKTMMVARVIHMIITIGNKKIANNELLPTPTVKEP